MAGARPDRPRDPGPPPGAGPAWDLDLPAQLLPYVPVVGAAWLAADGAITRRPFLLVAGILLLSR